MKEFITKEAITKNVTASYFKYLLISNIYLTSQLFNQVLKYLLSQLFNQVFNYLIKFQITS